MSQMLRLTRSSLLLLTTLAAALAPGVASAADVTLDELIAGLRRAEAELSHAEYGTTAYRDRSAEEEPTSSADFYRHGDQVKTVMRFSLNNFGTGERFQEQATVIHTPELAVVKKKTASNPQLYRGALLQHLRKDSMSWRREVGMWTPADPYFFATAGDERSGSSATWLERVRKNPDLVLILGEEAKCDFWPAAETGEVDLVVKSLLEKRRANGLDVATRLVAVGDTWVVQRERAYNPNLVINEVLIDYDLSDPYPLPLGIKSTDSEGVVTLYKVERRTVPNWEYSCQGSEASCQAKIGLEDANLTKFDIINDRDTGGAGTPGLVFADGDLVPSHEFAAAGGLGDDTDGGSSAEARRITQRDDDVQAAPPTRSPASPPPQPTATHSAIPTTLLVILSTAGVLGVLVLLAKRLSR